jgi:hypothetical protein
MTRAPFSAPTHCATARRAVGRAAANPAGAGKWMPSPRRRGGACAPRPCAFLRGFSFDCDEFGKLLPLAAKAELGGAKSKANAHFEGEGVLRGRMFHVGSLTKRAQISGLLVGNETGAGFASHGGTTSDAGARLHGQPKCLGCGYFCRVVCSHVACVGWWLSVDGFGERHVVLFAQGLSIALVGESTEDFGAVDSTHDNPMGAVVVEDRNLTADGFGFGAVCSHDGDTISCRLESVNRYFKKKTDFFGGWQSGTYGCFYRRGRAA